MALSNDLISQFAKLTKREAVKKAEQIVYGTVVEKEGSTYVQFDGSDILTPMISTTNVGAGERVSVTIKNHTATIMGNITSPSARSTEVVEVKTEVEAQIVELEESISLKVGNIKVGGRNLLLDSEQERSQIRETQNFFLLYDYSPTLLEIDDRVFTFSCEAYGSVPGMRVDFCFRDSNVKPISPEVAIDLSTEYARYSQPAVLNEGYTVKDIKYCYFRLRGGTGTVYIRRAKLERGTIPTDWTPAPEDAESDISDLESRVKLNETAIEMNKDAIEIRATEIENLDDRVSTAEAKILVMPDQISAAVGAIEVGGNNLLLGTQYWMSDYWVRISSGTVTDEVLTLDASGQTTGYIDTYQEVNLKAGETYTLSVDITESVSGSGNADIFAYDTTNPTSYHVVNSTDVQAGRYHTTFTVNDGSSTMRIYIRAFAGMAFNVAHIQLEKGNTPTAWRPSPEDNAKGILNGTNLEITKERFLVETPEFQLNVNGDDGDATFGADGLSINHVNSPSVKRQYNGPTSLTVGGTVDGESVFASLKDIFNKLSGSIIPNAITITIAAGTYYEGEMALRYTEGANITINATDVKIHGRLLVNGLRNKTTINGLTLEWSGTSDAVDVYNSSEFIFKNGMVTASRNMNTWANAFWATYSSVELVSCGFYNGYAGIFLDTNCRMFISGCYGSDNNYGLYARNNATAGVSATCPAGETATTYVEPDSEIRGTFTAATGTESGTPTAVTSVTLSATATRSVYGSSKHSGSSWYSSSATQLAQGAASGAIFHGCMWFDLSSISGKTITSATITLYRLGGVGAGTTINACIATMTNTGASGSLSPVTKYGIIGAFNQKETLTVTIPAAAVQELASGTAKGLYVYSEDGSYWGDRNYSRNYAQFAGTGSGNAPVLTVMYT